MNTSDENSQSDVAPPGRRVLVVVNTSAGSGKRHRAVQHLLTELARHELEVETIDSLTALSAVAQQEFAAGTLRGVVAAGGDGTVSEVINRTGAEIPIAVFPLGTENLLAKYFGITAEPRTFAEMIAQGADDSDRRRAGQRAVVFVDGERRFRCRSGSQPARGPRRQYQPFVVRQTNLAGDP